MMLDIFLNSRNANNALDMLTSNLYSPEEQSNLKSYIVYKLQKLLEFIGATLTSISFVTNNCKSTKVNVIATLSGTPATLQKFIKGVSVRFDGNDHIYKKLLVANYQLNNVEYSLANKEAQKHSKLDILKKICPSLIIQGYDRLNLFLNKNENSKDDCLQTIEKYELEELFLKYEHAMHSITKTTTPEPIYITDYVEVQVPVMIPIIQNASFMTTLFEDNTISYIVNEVYNPCKCIKEYSVFYNNSLITLIPMCFEDGNIISFREKDVVQNFEPLVFLIKI
jgi:hypothetical protein